MKRIHNFSAGPAALPLEVLKQIQEELIDFRGAGMSIMEMSHRGKIVDTMHKETQADLKELLGVGDDYSVIFMGGGARTQFAVLARNMFGKPGFAEYVNTGVWAETALKEAKKFGEVREIWSSAADGHNHVPQPGEIKIDQNASYFHYTSNNTIYGTQWQHVPVPGQVPMVCDMSSDFLSRPIDAKKYGVMYAGAQKNIGPAGVTVIVVRKDLLSRSPRDMAEMLSWANLDKDNSMLNTPPVFPIYVVGLVLKYLKKNGGLVAMDQYNQKKSKALYDAIDNSGGFYRAHAKPNSRSHMNVNFRLPTEELEEKFVAAAKKLDMEGLKGHRSVGGIRASIYNAVPIESVQALVSFMDEFKRTHG